MTVVLLAKCQKCDATREVFDLDWSKVMCVDSACGAEIENDLFGVYSRNPLISGDIDISVARRGRSLWTG